MGLKQCWRIVTEDVPRCAERPSPRSSARCEKPKGHEDGWHAGRTRCGYWKFWDSTPSPDPQEALG